MVPMKGTIQNELSPEHSQMAAQSVRIITHYIRLLFAKFSLAIFPLTFRSVFLVSKA
jgi:hypothetical protein